MTELASPNSPLVLADGTVINPITGAVQRDEAAQQFVEIPTAREAIRELTSIRRRISDLPVPPKQMNLVNLVVMYTLFGLCDQDIAVVLSVTEQQIKNIKWYRTPHGTRAFGRLYILIMPW